MNTEMKRSENDLIVELDGVKISPQTVDARALLSVAQAYVELLVRVADENESELTLTSLQIIDKCVGVLMRADDPDAAWVAVSEIDSYLAGAPIPHGVKNHTETLLEALHRLPPTVSAAAHVGTRSTKLIDRRGQPVERPWSRTTLWVKPIKIGGRREHIVLESGSERGTFRLDLSLETARELGPYLKKEILVEMEIARGADGRIEKGRLLSWTAPDVKPGQELEAWQKWFDASVDVPPTKHENEPEND